MSKKEKTSERSTFQNVIDIIIKLGVLFGLIFWCFQIIKPFIMIFIWGGLIAITLYPLYKKIVSKLGKRTRLSAIIVVVLLLAILFVPAFFLTESLVEGIKEFGANLQTKSLEIPVANDAVLEWPVIGKPFHSIWQASHENLGEVVGKYDSQIVKVGQWFLNALLSTGMGFIQFILSIIIAGVLLASSEKSDVLTRGLFVKLLGKRADEFIDASEKTIRNVAKGVIGVSLIQSFVLGIIFMIAGIPYAGLWALLCLILTIIQVGPMVVTIPVIIYLFVTESLGIAIVFGIFIILASLIDNFLKPIMMGKGAPAPMLIIFLGAVGGFMFSGFIGLFLGAIILSLGYKLFMTWIKSDNEEEIVNIGEENTEPAKE